MLTSDKDSAVNLYIADEQVNFQHLGRTFLLLLFRPLLYQPTPLKVSLTTALCQSTAYKTAAYLTYIIHEHAVQNGKNLWTGFLMQ